MKKVLLFLGMFLMLKVNAFALGHLELVRINGVYSSQLNMDTGDYFSSNQKKYIIDGRIVYCVEPGINIMTMDYDFTSDLSKSNFSKDIIDKISLIGYFGYDYPGHQTDNYFLAAQELIWETIGNNEIHFTTGINDTGNMINIDFEKNEIMSLVNHYSLKPSFDRSSVSGIYGDEIILTDKNKVLSNFDIVSGDDVSIDGNKLTIKLNSLGKYDINLVRRNYDNSSSVFYFAPNSQDFMFLRSDNIVTSNVSVNSYIPYSNIKVVKSGLVVDGIDENNNFIYKSKGLTGVKFGLYAANDIYKGDILLYKSNEFIEELVTVDGVAVSRDLPNGNYYLKEISTLDEFILDDNIVNIQLDNSKDEVFTYMVDLKNERKNIFINLRKNGEFFEEIINGGGSFFSGPLGGIVFGLYSSNDIFDSNNCLLVKKGELIKTFITNSNGIISEKVDIPFGTYYLKELKTLPGYKIDNNVYEFSIIGNSSNDIHIMIGKEPILNEMIKSNLIINKIDEYGNKLSGACFKLFDSFNNLIYEGCTDSDGIISINDLPYGKYHFYEVSSPDGYLVSNKIYDVNIIDDSSIVKVDVLNVKMPVTSDIYALPKKLSMIGLGFGLLSLSVAIVYDKKNRNC